MRSPSKKKGNNMRALRYFEIHVHMFEKCICQKITMVVKNICKNVFVQIIVLRRSMDPGEIHVLWRESEPKCIITV